MRKYENYSNALDVLKGAYNQDLNNEFVQSGIIDKFFLQFELGWKLFKALLSYEGDPIAASGSPREIIKTAYRYYDFMDQELWLGMLRDRNNVAHDYDRGNALELVEEILRSYIPEFEAVREGLQNRYGSLLTESDGSNESLL